MQNNIGHFASVFAPQAEDNSEIFKYIIDAVVLVASIGSSFAWNIGRYMFWRQHVFGANEVSQL